MYHLTQKRVTYISKEHQFAPVVKLPLQMRLIIKIDPAAWSEKTANFGQIGS